MILSIYRRRRRVAGSLEALQRENERRWLFLLIIIIFREGGSY